MTSASFLRLLMEPSILCGQHGKCFFELRGELALALIAHGPGDLSHAVVALQQQSGGPLHAVLADMGGDGAAVHLLEQFLHGGGVHEKLPGQLLDGDAAVQMLRQEPMDLPDDLQLLRRTAAAVVVLIQRWQMGRTGHQLTVRLGARHLHRALDDLVQQLRHLRIRRPVVDLLPHPAADDEAAVLQLPQMVGGGGAAHTHQRRQIHDALLTVAQQPEDPYPAVI